LDVSIDQVNNVSANIMRGNSDWMVSLATRLDGTELCNVKDYEFANTRWDKSLMETEVLVTAWLAGRGFVIRTPWRTAAFSGDGSQATQTEAEFARP
jgi:hypothetical protein